MLSWKLISYKTGFQSCCRFSTVLYDTDRLQSEFKVSQLIDGSSFVEHPASKKIYETLPPAVTVCKNKKYPHRIITKQEIEEMKQLRLEQPDYWTQKRLSDKFQIPTIR